MLLCLNQHPAIFYLTHHPEQSLIDPFLVPIQLEPVKTISTLDVNEYRPELNSIGQVQYIETNYVYGKREGIEFYKNHLGQVIGTKTYKNDQIISHEDFGRFK